MHLLDRSTWFEAPRQQQLQTNSKRYADWTHKKQAVANFSAQKATMMSMMTAKDSPGTLRRGAGGGGAARKADSQGGN